VDGESGLLFPVGKAEALAEQLLSLRARREWRLELGRNAMRRARQEFSIDSMIRNYEQFYESLVSAAAPAVALAGG
jgi:glycosyltransferase involved in cell wall biosynthesis